MSIQEIRRQGFEEMARAFYSEKHPERYVNLMMRRNRVTLQYMEKCTECMWIGYNAAIDKATTDFMETLNMITDLGYATPETLEKIAAIIDGRDK